MICGAAAFAIGAVVILATRPDRPDRQAPGPATAVSGARSAGAPAAAAAPLAGKEFYRIDSTPSAPCAAASICEVRLQLTALGDYKVNRDYPFKFVPQPSAAVRWEDPGTYTHESATSGVLRLRFRAEQPGTSQLTGVFKLSVCTEAVCEIEEPTIVISVQVS